MKKPFKKVISLAAAAVMALSSFSLTAFAVDSYELYVNGEQFTSDNLTIACGDGTAVFDGVDTLTLNNATIDKPSGSPAGETLWGVINSGIADLKIVLNGDNVLDGDGQSNDGIDAVGGCSVTIKGNGTLNLNDCYYGTYIGYWEVAGADLIHIFCDGFSHRGADGGGGGIIGIYH